MWLIAAAIGFAWAQDETPPAPVEPETLTSGAFHDDLAAAKRALYEGRNEESKALFEALRDRLNRGERPPESIAREALVFLGDVQYLEGEQDAARQTFRRVLLKEPEHVISPYHHTEDVRAFFSLVKERVKAEIARRPPPPVPEPPPPPPPPPKAMPVWGYLPLGIPQFKRGRGGAGALYGGLQLGAASASIATYVIAKRGNTDPSGHPFNWSAEQVDRRVRGYRQFGQWPATTAFYGLWVASVLDASIEWRRSEKRRVHLVVTPRGASVGGQF